jgi:Ran GTPase-activating protein (RanGAP) involved in mRNA processing and transport
MLKMNISLESIDLCENDIGVDGARNIAEALELNSSLQNIYLDFNNIGDEGAEMIAEALKENSSLQSVGLAGNNIQDNLQQKMNQYLLKNQNLFKLKHKMLSIELFLSMHDKKGVFDRNVLLYDFFPLLDISVKNSQ